MKVSEKCSNNSNNSDNHLTSRRTDGGKNGEIFEMSILKIDLFVLWNCFRLVSGHNHLRKKESRHMDEKVPPSSNSYGIADSPGWLHKQTQPFPHLGWGLMDLTATWVPSIHGWVFHPSILTKFKGSLTSVTVVQELIFPNFWTCKLFHPSDPRGSQREVYQEFQPSYDIFRRWCPGLFRPQVPCTPSLHCPIANSASTQSQQPV